MYREGVEGAIAGPGPESGVLSIKARVILLSISLHSARRHKTFSYLEVSLITPCLPVKAPMSGTGEYFTS